MISFQRAIDALESPALLIGRDLRVAYANGAAYTALGYPDGQLSGVSVGGLLDPRRRGEVRNFEELLRGGSARRVRSVVRRYDGSASQITLTLTPCLDEVGRVVAITLRMDTAAVGSASLPPLLSTVPPAPGSEPPSTGVHSRRPLNARERLMRETLPDGCEPPVEADGERPVRTSEERLSPTGTIQAPGEVIAGELDSKLQRVHMGLEWFERRLKQLHREGADSPQARSEALRVACELRVLVERALELSGQLRQRSNREEAGS